MLLLLFNLLLKVLLSALLGALLGVFSGGTGVTALLGNRLTSVSAVTAVARKKDTKD